MKSLSTCLVITVVLVLSSNAWPQAETPGPQSFPPDALKILPFPVRGEITVQVTVPDTPNARAETLSVALSKPPSDAILVERQTTLNGKRDAACDLNVSQVEPGTCEVVVSVLDDHANALLRGKRSVEIPPRPAWLGSKAGLCDGLLPGWQPLQAEDDLVLPWGRQYRFDGMPAPVEVVTAGRSVLTGPIRFVARSEGKQLVWTAQSTHVEKVNEGIARVTAEADCGTFRLVSTMTVEFDGMIKSDWQIIPKEKIQLDYLGVEVPFKTPHARYLYSYPGRWGSSYNVGSTPEQPVDMPFRPFVWLGDEERGFCWFSESDQNFFVSDPAKVTQIQPGAEETLLRINMVNVPTELDKPLDYTFGFQATPVRDNPEDAWDYRICHHGSYGIEETPYTLASKVIYPAQGNFNPDAGTLEAWVRVDFDPNVELTEPEKRGSLNRELFTLSAPNSPDRFGFYWNIDDRGMRAYLKKGEEIPLCVGSKCDWKQGEWHHIAVTWGSAVAIWIDGKKVAERAWEGTLKPAPEGAEMLFQCLQGHFALDEIRVSDVARAAFDVTQPPVEDEHTLLLDHFEGLNPLLVHTKPAKGTGGAASGIAPKTGPFGVFIESCGADKPITTLDRLAELGVRTICFHEHWTDIQNYTSTTHGAELTKLVKACHERKIRLIPYFGYEISDIAPEWPFYSKECLVSPRAGGYHRLPEQHASIVCYQSAWQDFMADGIARAMDEYDLDGVYLDGTADPWECHNLKHGCGYIKPDGSIGGKYAIFATREMMKRIWMIVKSRKPDGMINVHQSTVMTIPTIAFATSYWDGEQFGGIERGKWSLEVLPLDAFRCEFMGHQWGVPAELLCYDQPYTHAEALSFSLLHDILVRGNLGGSLEMESKLWKAMDRFGRKQARWLPYWSNQEYVSTDSAETKVSLYSRGEDGLVAIVSNLAEKPREVEVRLNRQALGLPENLTAWDIVNEHDMPLTAEPGIRQSLNPLEFRAIWIRTKESN